MTTLMNLLAEDVTFWGDGGGKVKGAATHPITGRVTDKRKGQLLWKKQQHSRPPIVN